MDPLNISFGRPDPPPPDKLDELAHTVKLVARDTVPGGTYAHKHRYAMVPVKLIEQLRRELDDLGVNWRKRD